jgi:hypothetical protein
MLKAVLFLVQRGHHSPAHWFFQAHENRVLQWLLRGLRPSRARWYAFRARLAPFLDDLNRQMLTLARRHGLLDVQVPVLDGTLLAANSTRHKLLNQASLLRRILLLEQAIAAEEAAGRPVPGPAVDAAPASQSCDEASRSVAAPDGDGPLDAGAQGTADGLGGSASVPVAAVLPQPATAGPLAEPPSPKATPAGVQGKASPLPVPVVPAGAARAAAGGRPGWMAQTAGGRVKQREHYREVEEELQKRLGQNAKRRKEDRKPVEQVRISPGDPEASLGLDKMRVYRPLYNAQVACDLDTDFCLAYEVFSGVSDGATLLPMLGRLRYFLAGEEIRWLLADAGYANGPNLRQLEKEGVVLLAPWQENDWSKGKKGKKQIPKSEFVWEEEKRAYRCPSGHLMKYERTQTKRKEEREEKYVQYRCAAGHCLECPRQGECTSRPASGRMVVRGEYEEEVQRHKGRMERGEAKDIYRKRKEQVERRIADSKQHRELRRLSMRGKEGARVQVGLVVLASNIVTFDKLASTTQDASPARSLP